MKPQRSESDELRIIKRLIAVALGVAILIGVVFYWSSQSQINDIVQVRGDARTTSCDDSRHFQLAHNALVQHVEDFLMTTRAAGRAAEFERDKVPVRVCDADHVARFYESRGTFGCEQTAANPDGRCKDDAE